MSCSIIPTFKEVQNSYTWNSFFYSVNFQFSNSAIVLCHLKAEVSQSSITVLTKNSLVMSSKRVVLKSRCALDLRQFPLDRQTCPLCFSSYEYKDSEQLISWKPNAVDIDPNLNSTATFDIVPSLVKETHTQQWGDDIFYTKLCVHVQFKRKFHIYIVTMFLPSISLVGLSWVSFWIDKKAVPARAGLTITTILAQITLITGTANKFPGVADLKIGDIYMIVNFFFVFGSLIEFAVVNNATGNEAAAEKNLSQEVSEKIGPQENNNFNLVSNEVTPNHLGGAGLNSTTAFSGSEKSPNREATELLAEENLSVMSTPYGQNVRNQKLLGASANQKTRSRTSIAKPLAFIPRLFKKKDIDDISKVSFPCSFILWHAIFIVLGHRALEGQEHL
ncbi:gamma-aminobutyric acid receptor subunit rho-1-like isoform X3 [Symsagittifera roscoffensis]|uniref:gamma-aminobutyric acid receptor subunit rho-1-like isoform X3 n=1 Tax=Symsagittifera roscoffensis TaxID=84072 RepID=UPI00307BDE37